MPFWFYIIIAVILFLIKSFFNSDWGKLISNNQKNDKNKSAETESWKCPICGVENSMHTRRCIECKYTNLDIKVENSQYQTSHSTTNKNSITKSTSNRKKSKTDYTNLPCDYVVFDLETTGLSAENNEIIEIGAIKYANNELSETFHTYVSPVEEIPKSITKLTGITNEMVEDAPEIDDAIEKFVEFVSDNTLVAHNSNFDIKFLNVQYEVKNNVIDTLKLARRFLPDLENHKLVTIKKHFNLNFNSHNALDDCRTTAYLYKYCYDKNIQNELSNPINSSPKSNDDFTQYEINILDQIKSIIKNDSPTNKIDIIQLYKTQTYCDISVGNSFMLRFKTRGKLQYMLVNEKFDKLSSSYKGNIRIEKSSKSEGNKTRVFFTDVNELDEFSDYIVNEYKNCISYKEENHSMNTDVTVSLYYDENGKIKTKVSEND